MAKSRQVSRFSEFFQQHLTAQGFPTLPPPLSTPPNARPRVIALLIASRRLRGPTQEDSSGSLSPVTRECAFVCADPQEYGPVETLYSTGLLKDLNAFQNCTSHNKSPVFNSWNCLTYSVRNNRKYIKSATFSCS